MTSVLSVFNSLPARFALLLCGFCLGLSISAAALAQERGVLLTITETDTGAPSFWWENPAAPTMTSTDRLLLQQLNALGFDAIDPSALTHPPSVSRRIFGHPHLSTTNALNLASLYDANRLLTGAARYLDLPPEGAIALHGARVELDLHLFAATTTVELMPLQVTATAYAKSPDAARAEALKQAQGRLGALLVSARGLVEAEVGVESAEPILVLTGLDRARPLVMIKRQLKSRDDVRDAREVWAAEGVIAVELNPGVVDEPARVLRAIDGLLLHDFEAFALEEVARDGQRIELRVVPKAIPLEP